MKGREAKQDGGEGKQDGGDGDQPGWRGGRPYRMEGELRDDNRVTNQFPPINTPFHILWCLATVSCLGYTSLLAHSVFKPSYFSTYNFTNKDLKSSYCISLFFIFFLQSKNSIIQILFIPLTFVFVSFHYPVAQAGLYFSLYHTISLRTAWYTECMILACGTVIKNNYNFPHTSVGMSQ